MTDLIKAVHSRLYYHYGSAKNYPCVDCNKPACDWSWNRIGDRNSEINYDPRCKSCHVIHDNIGKYELSKRPRGEQMKKKLTEKDVIWIRNMAGKCTQAEMAKIFDVHQVTISEVITRKIWKHI